MDDVMDDPELSTLLHDAVADVEPTDRLAEVRERTESRPQRGRWYAASGALLAVAAAVTAVAVLGDPRPSDDGVDPATPPDSALYPVYFVGDTPVGPRLYREFQERPGSGGSLAVAAQLVASSSEDPDYRTPWPEGAFIGAQVTSVDGGQVIRVDLGNVTPDRPAGLSDADAELAVQQVVYTMQAVAQDETLPVQFFLDQSPAGSLIGVDVSEPIDTSPQLDVLSLMSISSPSERLVVDGSFVADGRASSFEGNVEWELRDADTGTVVLEGFATAGMDDHLVPWETDPIDVTDLAPGTYTFVASTSDPSDGEGVGTFTDTRTVVVQ